MSSTALQFYQSINIALINAEQSRYRQWRHPSCIPVAAQNTPTSALFASFPQQPLIIKSSPSFRPANFLALLPLSPSPSLFRDKKDIVFPLGLVTNINNNTKMKIPIDTSSNALHNAPPNISPHVPSNASSRDFILTQFPLPSLPHRELPSPRPPPSTDLPETLPSPPVTPQPTPHLPSADRLIHQLSHRCTTRRHHHLAHLATPSQAALKVPPVHRC